MRRKLRALSKMKFLFNISEVEYAIGSSLLVLYLYGWLAGIALFLTWIALIHACDHFYISYPSFFLLEIDIVFCCRGVVHRYNKPAIIRIRKTGITTEYFLFGRKHRIGGPAYNGRFYLFGVEYSDQDYREAIANKSEIEVAVEAYRNPRIISFIWSVDQRSSAGKLLAMRGEKQLLHNLNAARLLE